MRRKSRRWLCSGNRLTGKRLKALIPSLLPAIERHGHMKLEATVREQLLKVSAATIDRLLMPVRKSASQEKERRGSVIGEDSLLERVSAAAEERHLSHNSLLAYRPTWLKIIAWVEAEGLILETLPSETRARNGWWLRC